MIGVIDYGLGNIGSIINMLKKLNIPACAVTSTDEISQVDKLILPGVGAFDMGMERLAASGMIDAIKQHALEDKKGLLGICLGMQMLGNTSEEGKKAGLQLIPFSTRRFDFQALPHDEQQRLKIPHMGWNRIEGMPNQDHILAGIEAHPRYYFVHSYHAVCENNDHILMQSHYGYPFTAAVRMGNIYGFQFHPEKSHQFGMALLANYARE